MQIPPATPSPTRCARQIEHCVAAEIPVGSCSQLEGIDVCTVGAAAAGGGVEVGDGAAQEVGEGIRHARLRAGAGRGTQVEASVTRGAIVRAVDLAGCAQSTN